MKSKDIFFTLDARRRVEWVERGPSEVQTEKAKKHVIAADILKVRLAEGPVKATDVLEELKKEGIIVCRHLQQYRCSCTEKWGY